MQTDSTVELQQHPHQQQQEQEQQQDCDGLLGVVLITVAQKDQDRPDSDAAGEWSGTTRTLHRVSRKQLGTARSCIRRLNLGRYERARKRAAQLLVVDEGASAEQATAGAAAAEAPPIPWALLAATPSLTSLVFRAGQAPYLAAGTQTAAAAAAVVGSSAVPDVLAATLGRLRCLHVTDIADGSQLAHLGRLLGATTQLTRLVLDVTEEVVDISSIDVASAQLLEGLGVARPCWAALANEGDGSTPAGAAAAAAASAASVSTAAAEFPAAASSAAAAGSSSWLGALRHLKLPGKLLGLLDAWVSHLEGAPQLTALHLSSAADMEGGLDSLVACTGLQELVVHGFPDGAEVQLPEGFTQLTALTKLELCMCGLWEVPEVVLGLPQLRHLSLRYNEELRHIPDDISRLAQLQHLDISSTGVEELPDELGTWLPQLEGLEIDDLEVVEDVPQSLTRLSSLSASGSGITQVSVLSHLVRLKNLDMYYNRLQPPFQPLSRLNAMETLTFGWDEELSDEQVQQVAVPGPMPALRSLTLSGDSHVPVTQLQALMGAQQLTYLNLQHCADPEQLPALGQLPQLRQLLIGGGRGVRWGGSLPWLQQQPCLTFLGVYGCAMEGWQLEQLPAQLEELHLSWCTLEGEQPRELTQLSRLRSLRLAFTGLEQLPPWVLSLRGLEELDVTSCMISSWEALAQLPLLRRVHGCDNNEAGAFQDAPHLCWSLVR